MYNKKSVLDKKDFYKRYNKGEFGNRLRNWNSVEDLLNDEYPPTTLTARSSIPGAASLYNIGIYEIQSFPGKFRDFTFNESAPDHLLIFQGEIYRNTEHMHLHYSLSKTKMRIALRDFPEKPKTGIDLTTYLRYHMPYCDYEWLEYLLDTYDDHTIEFGVYSRSIGLYPGSRTIFWEVRKY